VIKDVNDKNSFDGHVHNSYGKVLS